MQKIVFAIGHFTETCLTILVGLGWIPNIIISVVLFFGLIYWLNYQGKYNKQAKRDNTLA